MEKLWALRVTLSNGQTHILADTTGSADDAANRLDDFEKSDAEWLETTDASIVARRHIVEVGIVPV